MPAEQQLVVAGARDATVAVAEQGAVGEQVSQGSESGDEGVSANVGCFSLSLSLSLSLPLSLSLSLSLSLAASIFLSLSLPLFPLSHTFLSL